MLFIYLKILQALNVWLLIKKENTQNLLQALPYLGDAHRTLWKLAKEFELHPALCFLQKQDYIPAEILPEIHNAKVLNAIVFLQENREHLL